MHVVNERNRVALMRGNAAMTLVDNIKVKNKMHAITLAKSANLPGGRVVGTPPSDSHS